MTNKLTLEGIFEVIDNHIESETQFMFVTDKDLAEIICEYVLNNYDLIDEEMELSEKYEDYYVSLYIDEDGLKFICESARCLDGTYKYSDAMNDSIDYFVCNDMSEYEADKYLMGDYCTWSWIEIVSEDDEEYCDCEDEELEDWQKQIVDIVEDFADRIEHEIENDGLCECGCTLRNMLVEMFYIARQIGFEDGMECGINSVEEKTVNINIDNLMLPNIEDRDVVEDLINKLNEFYGK